MQKKTKNVVHVYVGGPKDGHTEHRGSSAQETLLERCTDGGVMYANAGVEREDNREVVYRFEPRKLVA